MWRQDTSLIKSWSPWTHAGTSSASTSAMSTRNPSLLVVAAITRNIDQVILSLIIASCRHTVNTVSLPRLSHGPGFLPHLLLCQAYSALFRQYFTNKICRPWGEILGMLGKICKYCQTSNINWGNLHKRFVKNNYNLLGQMSPRMGTKSILYHYLDPCKALYGEGRGHLAGL